MSEVRKREMLRDGGALLLLILLLTVSGLAVGVGSAYFSDQDARSNKIRPGDSNFIRCRLLMDDEEILPYLTLETDTDNWEKSEDGYYYYKSALEIGEITTELMKEIVVSEDVPEELLKRGFALSVYAESYQQGQFLKDAWQEAWRHFEKNQKSGNEERDI